MSYRKSRDVVMVCSTSLQQKWLTRYHLRTWSTLMFARWNFGLGITWCRFGSFFDYDMTGVGDVWVDGVTEVSHYASASLPWSYEIVQLLLFLRIQRVRLKTHWTPVVSLRSLIHFDGWQVSSTWTVAEDVHMLSLWSSVIPRGLAENTNDHTALEVCYSEKKRVPFDWSETLTLERRHSIASSRTISAPTSSDAMQTTCTNMEKSIWACTFLEPSHWMKQVKRWTYAELFSPKGAYLRDWRLCEKSPTFWIRIDCGMAAWRSCLFPLISVRFGRLWESTISRDMRTHTPSILLHSRSAAQRLPSLVYLVWPRSWSVLNT